MSSSGSQLVEMMLMMMMRHHWIAWLPARVFTTWRLLACRNSPTVVWVSDFTVSVQRVGPAEASALLVLLSFTIREVLRVILR
ncbi:jg19393 [Pararge aegeria aegeria]|uniref:Jg19393 protein n=1 Tax=Pararge aegeria aegeria TaxID=348720 RepID=A0A8S4R925_9NEOP|nr:jg19393 [Pararge aegeria aegeria]